MWIKQEENNHEIFEEQTHHEVSNNELTAAIKKLHKLKAQGECLNTTFDNKNFHIFLERKKQIDKRISQNTKGCKVQLLIDNIVIKQTEIEPRKLTTYYSDYKNAFDTAKSATNK